MPQKIKFQLMQNGLPGIKLPINQHNFKAACRVLNYGHYVKQVNN